MRICIIENEENSLNLLKQILNEYCSDLELVGTAASIIESIELIDKVQPDLVFFDIELDDGHSFEIFDKLTYSKFKVIFTTAYDEYAIKAFQFDAIDYILKPYVPSQVVKAVTKARNTKNKDSIFEELSTILKATTTQRHSITIPTSEGIDVIRLDEIVRCEASHAYCFIIQLDGNKKIVSKSLSDIEKMVEFSQAFFRIHASHLVNLKHVKNLSTRDGDTIYLSNNENVPLARRRKKEFIEALQTRI